MNEKKIKELSKKNQKILKFLQTWEDDFHLYDLCTFHNMEIYNELEDDRELYLETMYRLDLRSYFKDKLFSFSTEGGTGYFAFWEYECLEDEAPIVLLATGGGKAKLLAGSLNDLVCKMIYNISFNGGWYVGKKPDTDDFEGMYDELIDSYEEHFKKEISVDDVKILLENDRQEFKEQALKLIDFVSEKKIKKNLKKHPSFSRRVDVFRFKYYELYYLKHEIKNEEELFTILEVYKAEIKNKYYDTKKKTLFKALEKSYPKYYNSEFFKNWLEDFDKPKSKEEQALEEEKIKNARLIADYTDLYLDGKIDNSYIEGFIEKYPKIVKEAFFQDWIKKAEDKNMNALMKEYLAVTRD